MKKALLVLAIAFAFASCGGNTENAETPKTDSAAVETPAPAPVVDSTKKDSAAVVTPAEAPKKEEMKKEEKKK